MVTGATCIRLAVLRGWLAHMEERGPAAPLLGTVALREDARRQHEEALARLRAKIAQVTS